MSPDRRIERPTSLEEVAEVAAMQAMTSGSARVGINAQKWNENLSIDTRMFYEEQVLPYLGDQKSRYPHRNLETAIRNILIKNPEYNTHLIIEVQEVHGVNEELSGGQVSTESRLQAIYLHRRDVWPKPPWLQQVPTTLFSYATVQRDDDAIEMARYHASAIAYQRWFRQRP